MRTGRLAPSACTAARRPSPAGGRAVSSVDVRPTPAIEPCPAAGPAGRARLPVRGGQPGLRGALAQGAGPALRQHRLRRRHHARRLLPGPGGRRRRLRAPVTAPAVAAANLRLARAGDRGGRRGLFPAPGDLLPPLRSALQHPRRLPRGLQRGPDRLGDAGAAAPRRPDGRHVADPGPAPRAPPGRAGPHRVLPVRGQHARRGHRRVPGRLRAAARARLRPGVSAGDGRQRRGRGTRLAAGRSRRGARCARPGAAGPRPAAFATPGEGRPRTAGGSHRRYGLPRVASDHRRLPVGCVRARARGALDADVRAGPPELGLHLLDHPRGVPGRAGNRLGDREPPVPAAGGAGAGPVAVADAVGPGRGRHTVRVPRSDRRPRHACDRRRMAAVRLLDLRQHGAAAVRPRRPCSAARSRTCCAPPRGRAPNRAPSSGGSMP